jgi:hypothetical protein
MKETHLSREHLEKMASIYLSNNFVIESLFGGNIGTSMFDRGSMFNHDCDPNAFQVVTYNKLLIYARKKISAGQEITITYKALGLAASSSSNLAFPCQCGHCNQVPVVPDEFLTRIQECSTYEDSIDWTWQALVLEENPVLLISYVRILLENLSRRRPL